MPLEERAQICAVMTDRRPSMGAEDFADYPTSVPGCIMSLGVRSPQKKIIPRHTSTFNLDVKALLLGVRLFTQILLAWPTQTP
jgi:amidohydrolase